jgi:hypothetical protein
MASSRWEAAIWWGLGSPDDNRGTGRVGRPGVAATGRAPLPGPAGTRNKSKYENGINKTVIGIRIIIEMKKKTMTNPLMKWNIFSISMAKKYQVRKTGTA